MNVKKFGLIVGMWLWLAVPGRAQNVQKPEVFYTVTVASYEREMLHVAMTVESPVEEKIAVAIPAWAPGYYQIAHYEKNILNVTVTDDGKKTLVLRHPDARTWETDKPANADKVVFEYDVHAAEPGYGFFGSHLYANGGYINGPSAFLYYVGHTDAAAHLTLEAKGVKQAAAALTSFGTNIGKTSDFLYHADSYDELVDTPIQFGNFKEIDFKVDETPFRVIVFGEWNYDKAKVVDALTKIARSAKAVFGSFPFHSYLFVYHIGGAGFEGGLEHRNSTVIHLNRTANGAPDDDFITTSAHEFFHAWNIKRLHPAALTPLDYSQISRTASLWFAEGVTDYYAYLLPVRAGLRTPEWFLKQMANTMNEQEMTPMRHSESLEDASRRIWEEGDSNSDAVSYYIKGALVGFYFDLRLRELPNSPNLDKVMRELDKTYGKSNAGYPEDALLTTINQTAVASLTDEYDRYVKGTDDIDWEALFAGFGFTMQREKIATLGVATEGSRDAATEFAPVVKKIYPGWSGEKLGLKLGDMVQNLNGVAVTQSNFAANVKTMQPGDALTMDVLRDGKIVHLSGEVGYRWHVTKITLTPEAELSPNALLLRRNYFGIQEAR